jgi:3-oxoacyl-[acyl-carrier protein] reductase
MPITWDFEGKVGIVTGASRGIGFATANLIVRHGGRVVITGRNQSGLDDALAALGPAARAVQGSIDDPGHADLVVRVALREFGAVDLLVNNAGINPRVGLMQDMDADSFAKTMSANLTAALALAVAAWRGWMDTHGGAIVNVSSISGVRPQSPLGTYGISKAAMLHLTKQLALDFAPAVRVNAVAPAVVRTEFAKPLYDGESDPTASYPAGRLGTVDDVAVSIAFLLSPESSWMTGEVLILDGGLSVRL